jgi:hypothetical protein
MFVVNSTGNVQPSARRGGRKRIVIEDYPSGAIIDFLIIIKLSSAGAAGTVSKKLRHSSSFQSYHASFLFAADAIKLGVCPKQDPTIDEHRRRYSLGSVKLIDGQNLELLVLGQDEGRPVFTSDINFSIGQDR